MTVGGTFSAGQLQTSFSESYWKCFLTEGLCWLALMITNGIVTVFLVALALLKISACSPSKQSAYGKHGLILRKQPRPSPCWKS